MDKKIPYPEITLTSCVDTGNDMSLLRVLSSNVCSGFIKKTIIDHYQGGAAAHRLTYPVGSRNFYAVPNHAYGDALNEYHLTTPQYSALWLPTIQLHIDQIRAVILNENPIIAWSGDDSIFTNERFVLGVDISLGEVELRFFQIRSHAVAELDQEWQILMVPDDES